MHPSIMITSSKFRTLIARYELRGTNKTAIKREADLIANNRYPLFRPKYFIKAGPIKTKKLAFITPNEQHHIANVHLIVAIKGKVMVKAPFANLKRI